MKTGRSLTELAAELERQKTVKRDLVVDTSALSLYSNNDQLSLSVNKGPGSGGITNIEMLDVGEIAHRQIGAHTAIPAKYYDRMRAEALHLLSENVNHWLHQSPTRRMVRTLDGRARAFLSDRYRRIDNHEIAETVLPIIGKMQGAEIISCELTESRMYLKVVNPRLETEVKKGDIVQAGIVISNSETGQGAVNVHPLIYRLVCLNGMIAAGEGQRKYHVGRGIEADDNYEVYRDETVAADDKAFMLKLQDTVQAAMDEARFQQIVSRMQDATAAKITGVDIPKVVELTSKEYGLNQGENSGVLRHLIEGGDLSLFGISSAITRHSQDIESYDRATDLEIIGWNVLGMSRAMWQQINSVM